MVTLNEILDAAQNLPSSDRARLISSLWETTQPMDWVLPDPAWIAEANRRSEEFDAGKESSSLWTDVRQRAQKDAGLLGGPVVFELCDAPKKYPQSPGEAVSASSVKTSTCTEAT